MLDFFFLFRSTLSAFKICDSFSLTLHRIYINFISRYKLRETERRRERDGKISILRSSRVLLDNSATFLRPCRRKFARVDVMFIKFRQLSFPLSLVHPARNQRAIIRSVARQSFKLVGRPPTRGCPRRHRLRRDAGRRRGGGGGRERKRIPRAIMTCMVTFNGSDAPVAR